MIEHYNLLSDTPWLKKGAVFRYDRTVNKISFNESNNEIFLTQLGKLTQTNDAEYKKMNKHLATLVDLYTKGDQETMSSKLSLVGEVVSRAPYYMPGLNSTYFFVSDHGEVGQQRCSEKSYSTNKTTSQRSMFGNTFDSLEDAKEHSKNVKIFNYMCKILTEHGLIREEGISSELFDFVKKRYGKPVLTYLLATLNGRAEG